MPATQITPAAVQFEAQLFVTVEVAADGTVRVLVPEVAPGDLMEFACHATIRGAGYDLENDPIPGEAAAAIQAAHRVADEALADDVYVTILYP